jgi:hypothetical protein
MGENPWLGTNAAMSLAFSMQRMAFGIQDPQGWM